MRSPVLTKQPKYFYDADAVREQSTSDHGSGNGYKRPARLRYNGRGNDEPWEPTTHRNRRTVWTIPTAPFAAAHFATFPPALVEPCIKAGTSEKGVCPTCGASWKRVTQKVATGQTQKMADGWDTGEGGHGTVHRNGREAGVTGVPVMASQTIGWEQSCKCPAHEPIPSTVLDPFVGSGTTLMVANRLGRNGIGIELSPEYAAMAVDRIKRDDALFVEVALENA